MGESVKAKRSINAKSIFSFLENNAIIVGLLVFAIAVAFLRENFASYQNFKNLTTNVSVRFIIALGVSGCLITKGTDLSAGRIVGLAACIGATLLQRADYNDKFFPNMGEPNILLIVLVVVVICGFIGILNGAVISYLKVPPFLATLGMQTFVYGICTIYTGSNPIGGLRKDFTGIATGTLFGNLFKIKLSGPLQFLEVITYLLIISVVCGLVIWFLYNKTRHGKYMYAIGGNENAAEVSGINTSKSKILIYMTAGIMYAIAGMILAAKAGGASVGTGLSYELEAIAACTIGGVSTNGGVGRVSGILIGVLVFELLKISLQFLGVEPAYTFIIQGLVIVFAVALDLRKYLAKK